ncbi:MAG: glycosyltransferase family 39 protein [bacterium]
MSSVVFNRKVQIDKGLIAVIAVALALRLLFLFVVSPTLTSDSRSYIYTAKTFISGSVPAEYESGRRRAPGYPLFLAAIYQVSDENNFLVVSIQHLLGISVVWMVFYLCLIIFGSRWVALAASLLAASDFYILFYEHAVLSDFLQLFFLISGIFTFALYIKEGKVAHLITAGIFAALLALTKDVFYLFPIVIIIAIFLYRGVKIPAWKGIAAYIISFLVIVSGWQAREYLTGDRIAKKPYLGRSLMVNAEFFLDYESPKYKDLKELFKKYEHLRYDHGGDYSFIELYVFNKYREQTGLLEAEIDRIYTGAAMEAIRHYPWKYAGRILYNIYIMYFPQSEYTMRSLDYVDGRGVKKHPEKVMILKNTYRWINKVLVLLFLAGLALSLFGEKDRAGRVLFIVLVMSICYSSILSCMLNVGLVRYRVPIEPLIMMFSGMAVCRAAGMIAARVKR